MVKDIVLNFDGMVLPITALVIDNLDCDIHAGVPFCKHNDIEVHLKREEISVKDKRFSYGTRNCCTARSVSY